MQEIVMKKHGDVHPEWESVLVDCHMPLYTLDTLPPVYARDCLGKPCADTLTVYDRHGREHRLPKTVALLVPLIFCEMGPNFWEHYTT